MNKCFKGLAPAQKLETEKKWKLTFQKVPFCFPRVTSSQLNCISIRPIHEKKGLEQTLQDSHPATLGSNHGISKFLSDNFCLNFFLEY